MINIKYFLKGFFCIKSVNSPAIALAAGFIAIGALFKSIGLNIQESVFSTFLTYAMPGSLIMAESLIVGASLLNIFFAVWLVNARLYPMTVSLFPLVLALMFSLMLGSSPVLIRRKSNTTLPYFTPTNQKHQ